MGKHIILIGFMGTGKSTVGQMLAEQLECPWLDTDTEVERLAGKSIPQLFEEEGEAHFRRWEKRVLQQVLEQTPSVITTGGGIVLDPENVFRIRSRGWVVALDASEEELLRRLTADRSRPLLRGDVRKRVTDLKKSRRNAYNFADFSLDTTGKSPQETAEKILQQWKEISQKFRV
ncbi:shikimate kinase [Kroppenstedtia guangzhouensis]|jgi:shikimate kinase|uniref:Shikimate kinase n=1 Tax=Kroppenstedtia guangzhouensis TaxID=1274356 RepID=A0ABQ1FW96_9BACL|nr:shikimate kinase [Kroppenstedtia guangzhouensis]GGA31549.1 shikimate kinase [Kroppenstedtia guangzhouensis]